MVVSVGHLGDGKRDGRLLVLGRGRLQLLVHALPRDGTATRRKQENQVKSETGGRRLMALWRG